MAINKSRILEDMVDRVQRMLDSGESPPFQKPWTPLYGELSKPHNPVTNHAYSGMNAFNLALEGALMGYEDPRWMGYQQARDQGWQVRKGEKAATIYLPVSIRINADQPEGRGQGEGKTAGEGGEQGKESKLLVFKAVKVFNAQQIDGIPSMEKVPERDLPPKSAEVDAIAQVMGVPIQEIPGDRAFYIPQQDSITLPLRSTFHDQHGYDATRLHELSHATGHPERLNRNMGGRFGSPSYAAEEVTAEISAWLTSQSLAIPHTGGNPDMTAEQHAIYIAGWAEAIKADPKAFAKAIDNGLKASQHLQQALERAQEQGLVKNRGQDLSPHEMSFAETSKESLAVPAIKEVSGPQSGLATERETLPEQEIKPSQPLGIGDDDGLEMGF